MTHRRIDFAMPAPAAVVFDAFHYRHWRHQWDSLVSDTAVEGGPRRTAWIIRPFVERIFDYQTHKRFGRLRTYLASHAGDIERC